MKTNNNEDNGKNDPTTSNTVLFVLLMTAKEDELPSCEKILPCSNCQFSMKFSTKRLLFESPWPCIQIQQESESKYFSVDMNRRKPGAWPHARGDLQSGRVSRIIGVSIDSKKNFIAFGFALAVS